MMRRIYVLTGLLVLQSTVSAEYLRDRQIGLDERGARPAGQLVPPHVGDEDEFGRQSKELGEDRLIAYTDMWETFVTDQFSSMSIPTTAPTRQTKRPTTRRPITAPPRTPRPTMASTKGPAPVTQPSTLSPGPSPTNPPPIGRPSKAPKTVRPTPSPSTMSPVMPPTSMPVLAPVKAPMSIPTLAPVTVTSAPITAPPTLASPSQGPIKTITAAPSAAPVAFAPSAAPSGSPGNTVLDVIQSTPRYSRFANAVRAADLSTTLENNNQLTAFVPNNSAMNDRYILETLLPNTNYQLHLKSLVRNHLTGQGVYTTANLTNGLQLAMLGNEQTNVAVAGSDISLETFAARLQYTDVVPLDRTNVVASNGVLHEVGTVLYPAWSFLDLNELLRLLETQFSTLISLLESSGLAQTLQNARNLTLIAPTNEAFAALPDQVLTQLSNPGNVDQLSQILLYHVVPGVVDFELLPTGNTVFSTEQGEDVTIGRRQRPNGSIDLFFNGNRSSLFYLTRWNIMYQVEEVLLPPSYGGTLGPTSAPASSPSPTPSSGTGANLASIIAGNPNYSTLTNLLIEGRLLNTLNRTNSGPFTIYAPTDDAFGELGDAYLSVLATDGYSLHLSSLLLDHVQNGRITSDQLVDGLVITMANGLSVTVSNDGASVQLISSSVELGETPAINIILPEVPAQNGILYQVDSVIYPAWYFFNAREALNALPDTFGIFNSLIEQAGLTRFFNNLVGKTIVGPNDAAFQSLPAASLSFLTNLNNLPILSEVLLYHVLQELYPFTTLPVGSFDASTLLGEDVAVTVSQNTAGGKLLAFNGISGVGRGFYLTKNNLIYEVGGVLIPPSLVDVIPT